MDTTLREKKLFWRVQNLPESKLTNLLWGRGEEEAVHLGLQRVVNLHVDVVASWKQFNKYFYNCCLIVMWSGHFEYCGAQIPKVFRIRMVDGVQILNGFQMVGHFLDKVVLYLKKKNMYINGLG